MPNTVLKLCCDCHRCQVREGTCNSTKTSNEKMLNLKKWYTTVFLCHNWHVTTIISYYYRDQLPRSTGAPKEEKSKPLSCQAWEITVLHYHNCGLTVKIMQTTNKHFDYSLCCAVEIRSSILWCIMNVDLEEHFHKKLCKISETFRVMCGFLHSVPDLFS